MIKKMSTLEKRLAEEIERVGGITHVAARIGVDRNTIRNWINRGTVTSKRLQELAEEVQIDLQYIVLGLRSPEKPVLTVQQEQAGYSVEMLNKEELALLDNYRNAPEIGKKAIQGASNAVAQPKVKTN